MPGSSVSWISVIATSRAGVRHKIRVRRGAPDHVEHAEGDSAHAARSDAVTVGSVIDLHASGTVPELRTDRLVLRDWRESDLEPFGEINADPVVMEHFPSTLDAEGTRAMVERQRERWRDDGMGWWAVEHAATGEFVGTVGLMRVDFAAPFHDVGHPVAEVGWRLARSAWGQGYATEAARASLAWGFDDVGLDEIVSFTVAANKRSRRVMERLGMVRDPSVDFEHPRVDPDSPLRHHVVYRLRAPRSPAIATPTTGSGE